VESVLIEEMKQLLREYGLTAWMELTRDFGQVLGVKLIPPDDWSYTMMGWED
jgi:hypothetical protein